MKRFDCDSVVPGCDRVFTGPGDQSVLDQVVAHAAADHGLVSSPLSFLELVLTHTRPITPGRTARSTGDTLRMVGVLDPTITATTARRRRPPAHRIRSGTSSEFSNVRPLHPEQAIPATPSRPHATFRHECLFHAGPAEFLQAVVPFVREGLDRGEPVLLAVSEPRRRAVRTALGTDADRVLYADAEHVGNPAMTIPMWRDFVDRHCGPGRPVRGIGENLRAGSRPAEVDEAQLREALLNAAVPPATPLWLLCPYDTTDLGDAVLTQALRSHPVFMSSTTHCCSGQYGGRTNLAALYREALTEPRAAVTVIPVDPRRQHHIHAVLGYAVSVGLPVNRAARLAAAVHDLTRVAGGAEVRLRIWTQDRAVTCEMVTFGLETSGTDVPADCRTAPSLPEPQDRAVRLAGDLCDLVQTRFPTNTATVRMHCWLPS